MGSLISIQLNGSADVTDNVLRVTSLIREACAQAKLPRLVVLPECFSIFGTNGNSILNAAEIIDNGPVQQALSQLAKDNNCFLVAGTQPIKCARQGGKYFAASLVYNPRGERIARYNKIHLFDVDVADKTAAYRESRYTIPGEYISLFDSPFGEVAQTVCYDLRFSELFAAFSKYTQSKQAPSVVVVPSAFTLATGKAHWHALLQARSIENQCFVVASNQTGTHNDGRETFGNSCIYSPWGECLSVITEAEGYAIADFDVTQLQRIRASMPINEHKKERYKIE